MLAANDQVPVHFAYPTTAWVRGETVTDVYDLELPRQVPNGNYGVLVILYREADGQEVGRAELPPLASLTARGKSAPATASCARAIDFHWHGQMNTGD